MTRHHDGQVAEYPVSAVLGKKGNPAIGREVHCPDSTGHFSHFSSGFFPGPGFPVVLNGLVEVDLFRGFSFPAVKHL